MSMVNKNVVNNGEQRPWKLDACPLYAIDTKVRTFHFTKSSTCRWLSNSYTMACPPVRGDNPRALASGLSYVQMAKHGKTILYHLHQCRPCTS